LTEGWEGETKCLGALKFLQVIEKGGSQIPHFERDYHMILERGGVEKPGVRQRTADGSSRESDTNHSQDSHLPKPFSSMNGRVHRKQKTEEVTLGSS